MSIEFTIPPDLFNHGVAFKKHYYIPPAQGNLKCRPELPQYFQCYFVTEFSLNTHKDELHFLKVLKLFPFFPVMDPMQELRVVHLRGCLCRANAIERALKESERTDFLVIDKFRRVFLQNID